MSHPHVTRCARVSLAVPTLASLPASRVSKINAEELFDDETHKLMMAAAQIPPLFSSIVRSLILSIRGLIAY